MKGLSLLTTLLTFFTLAVTAEDKPCNCGDPGCDNNFVPNSCDYAFDECMAPYINGSDDDKYYAAFDSCSQSAYAPCGGKGGEGGNCNEL